MNQIILRDAVKLAATQPYALDCLTTWEVAGLSPQQELKLTIQDLRLYFEQGKLKCDLVTCIALFAAPKTMPAIYGLMLTHILSGARITYPQYERLAYFRLWPAPFAARYAAMRKTILYEATIEIVRERVNYFIDTNGEDNDYGSTKTDRSRTPHGGNRIRVARY